MAHYLLKTEPDEYSFDDLVRDHSTCWDGVTNALARRHLQAIQEGDEVLIYHTGDERQAVGLGVVVRGAYARVGANAPAPRRASASAARPDFVCDVRAGRRLPRPVRLDEIRGNAKLAGIELLRLPRLSVVPVRPAEWEEILRLAGMRPR
jgi:predicted RNA-binding protein with PUA-like domain